MRRTKMMLEILNIQPAILWVTNSVQKNQSRTKWNDARNSQHSDRYSICYIEWLYRMVIELTFDLKMSLIPNELWNSQHSDRYSICCIEWLYSWLLKCVEHSARYTICCIEWLQSWLSKYVEYSARCSMCCSSNPTFAWGMIWIQMSYEILNIQCATQFAV